MDTTGRLWHCHIKFDDVKGICVIYSPERHKEAIERNNKFYDKNRKNYQEGQPLPRKLYLNNDM